MSPPTRRWFQFRLTTWFVLVAILAWAMLLGPKADRVFIYRLYHNRPLPFDAYSVKQFKNIGEYSFGSKSFTKSEITRSVINPAHFYPALALAAFIGWKVAWAMQRRLKARTAPKEAIPPMAEPTPEPYVPGS